MRIITALALLAVTAAPAFAGAAEATKCAAGLDANGQTIFNATLPQVTPTSDLRTLLTTTTMSLVMGGKVPMSSAKTSATAAAQCLKLAQK